MQVKDVLLVKVSEEFFEEEVRVGGAECEVG